MNRCINDTFGYCSGEPESQETSESPILNYTPKTCIKDHRTCEYFLAHSEITSAKKEPVITNVEKPTSKIDKKPEEKQQQLGF